MKYSELAELYEKLENTTKRLEKTYILSEFLKKTPAEDIDKIVLLVLGRVFPPWDQREIGFASKMVIKALEIATGLSKEVIEKHFKKTGDLGLTAEELAGKKHQKTLFSSELSVSKVFENIRKLTTLTGAGSVDMKTKLVAELLANAKPLEARYIIRTVLEELRVGLGEGTIRDAIVWAFFGKEIGLEYDKKENNITFPEKNREKYNHFIEVVQSAYDIANDFSVVAKAAKKSGEKGLVDIEFEVGRPVKVMLAQKVADIKEGFERVEKPAAIEYKYDGFRIQIHRDKDEITLFTRRLENVTKQFPDVIKAVKEQTENSRFILDSEAVGYNPKTKKYRPFQDVSQRIKRKYEIEEMAKEFPVEVNVFDIIYYKDGSTIKKPFLERRKLIEKIVEPKKWSIVLAEQTIADNEKDVEKFYKQSLDAGNEGIMMKNLKAPYKPGSRVGFMVKLKPTMKELDLVIVGAEWGTGKRAGWLSSFVLACRDEETSDFLEVGKVGTGIKEKEEEGVSFEQLTKILKKYIISEKGKEVKIKPEIVVEVTYEEIQKSPTYSSGYALRFPRVTRLRDDRAPEEASTLQMVEEYFHEQKKR